MTRVLLLGYDPDTVDFSDPALPPGMNVEKVHAGIEAAMKQFASRGWDANVCLLGPMKAPGRQWSGNSPRQTMTASSSAQASGCRLASCQYSR